MSDASDALTGAAGLIDRNGWWSPEHRSLTGYDMRGAIDAAAIGATTFRKALAAIRAHLGTEDIEAWNNAEGRTESEVVGALRAAAKDAS